MLIDRILLGRRIKKIRNLRQLSQAKLAERIGVSVPFISHIETARTMVSLETLLKIANTLDVTVDTLLYDNQRSDLCEYAFDLANLLKDCSNEEKRFIYDMAFAVKASLRDSLLIKSEKRAV